MLLCIGLGKTAKAADSFLRGKGAEFRDCEVSVGACLSICRTVNLERGGSSEMTAGHLNLTVFSSVLFCFGTICTTPSEAVPQKPWYLVAIDHVLHAVHNEGQAGFASPNEADGKLEHPYVSRVTKDESSITLKGDVPTDGDLKILQGVAAATSPGTAFTDKSRLNASVPDRDAWLAAMTYALRQLAKLEHGTALLRNSSITIEGVTKPGDDFATVQKKLREEAPKGLNIQAAVKPHGVHPFVWLAQMQPGSLNLSGYVPDKQDQALCSYAQNLFQTLKVNNSMEFAEGEPHDWLEAAKLSLDMLSLLYAGNVAVSDNVIRLEGIYSSPAAAALLKTYSQKVPRGFRLEMHILEPVVRGPTARAEDINVAAHTAPASLNP